MRLSTTGAERHTYTPPARMYIGGFVSNARMLIITVQLNMGLTLLHTAGATLYSRESEIAQAAQSVGEVTEQVLWNVGS